jgi:hypothetical protein
VGLQEANPGPYQVSDSADSGNDFAGWLSWFGSGAPQRSAFWVMVRPSKALLLNEEAESESAGGTSFSLLTPIMT